MNSTVKDASPVCILHVCTIFLTARTFIAPIASYLQERGYVVHVACSPDPTSDGPEQSSITTVNGSTVHPVSISRSINVFQDLAAIWRLYKLIRQLRPVIVHTQTSKAGMVGRIAAWLARSPIRIHTAHAFPFHELLPAPLRWFYILLEKFSGKLTDLLIVDTNSVRSEGLKYRVIENPKNLVTIPMGVDLKKFSPSSVGPDNLRQSLGFDHALLVVGTVARLVRDKGLECFLQMAERIQSDRSDVRFLIVGDGPLRKELEHMSENLGIRKVVVFAGHQADVPAFMAAMDLFVLPTLREGFGVVFAEAMAMGKATIGSRIGPVEEVVEEGVTGFLVNPHSPEEFATKALELLEDEGKRLAFGKAGRARVEKYFDEQNMCLSIEQHYKRLLTLKGLAS